MLFPTALGLLLSVHPAAPPASHDEDPKILDRQAPHRGPGWRLGPLARRSGNPRTDVVLSTSIEFESNNVALLAWLTLEELNGQAVSGADCWGYVSPSGREYAIACTSHGTAFLDLSDASDPQVIDFVNGPPSLWRDAKVYQQYAYIVSEGGDGIQVVDLSQIDSGNVSHITNITSGGTPDTHNVALDTESGFLYRCGGDPDIGLRAYSLANPASPSLVGSWSDRYVHDAQVVTYTSGPNAGRQIAFACTGFNGGFESTGLDIIDVTTKGAMFTIERAFYPSAAYAHQCWLSEDRQYLYVNDELDEDGNQPTTTHMFDVSNLNQPQYLGSFTNGNKAVGHNLFVKGDTLYEGNYRSGLRVFDIANPTQPNEIAWFDTYPTNDEDNFNGLWAPYPFLPSGLIFGTDLEKGFFLWWVGGPQVEFDYPAGQPEVVHPDGDSFDVVLNTTGGASITPGSEQIHYDLGSGYQSAALVPMGGSAYRADLPPVPCGTTVEFYLTAETAGGMVWKDPPGSSGQVCVATAALGVTSILSYDMESTQGWSSGAPGDDADTGEWTRGDPIGTAAQPAEDHTEGAGTDCWFTGQGSPGGSLGENDVDDGKTTLLSPVMDLSAHTDPHIRYWRWYSNHDGSNPGADVFEVDLSTDGGQSWMSVELLGPSGLDTLGGWIRHELRLLDFGGPTDEVQMRFIASDEFDGSIVEAAVDDFEVFTYDCPDCNGNGIADGIDVTSGGVLDLDQNGVPDSCQPLSADKPSLSLAAGGLQNLTLDAGSPLAGQLYLVLGSASGSVPGTPFGAHLIPLNVDAYTTYTLENPGVLPLFNSIGLLNGQGKASARVIVAAGSDPSLVGVTLHHAYPVIDPGAGVISLVSNAIPVELTP